LVFQTKKERKKRKKERKGKREEKQKNTQQNMSLIRTVIVKVTIPMPTSTTNIQIHHFTTAFMSNVHCGSAV